MSGESPKEGPPAALRPRDFALLLLASSDLLPRQRARDQQADRTGMELKRQLLNHVAALDPEPEALEAALAEIIETMGQPTGPTRGVATIFRDEWQAACVSPEWIAQLLGQAVEESNHERSDEQSVRR
jgi:hypothetical protein